MEIGTAPVSGSSGKPGKKFSGTIAESPAAYRGNFTVYTIRKIELNDVLLYEPMAGFTQPPPGTGGAMIQSHSLRKMELASKG
jgi:hypothetical protein